MIQDIIARLGQYYTGFVNLPLEGQVICGVGAVVVLSALKNVWKMIFPVRWGAASLLRVAAFLVHPRKKTKKTKKAALLSGGKVNAIPFDLSNKKKTKLTYEFYSKPPMIFDLTDPEIDALDAARIAFRIPGNGRLTAEERRRKAITNAECAKASEVQAPPFDFSSPENTANAYAYYGGTSVVQTLTDAQIQLLDEMVTLYSIQGTGCLGAERRRRKAIARQSELTNPPTQPSEDVEVLKNYVAKLEAMVQANKEVEKKAPEFIAHNEDII